MVKRDLAAETCRDVFFLIVEAYSGLLEWSVRLLAQGRLMMADKVLMRWTVIELSTRDIGYVLGRPGRRHFFARLGDSH